MRCSDTEQHYARNAAGMQQGTRYARDAFSIDYIVDTSFTRRCRSYGVYCTDRIETQQGIQIAGSQFALGSGKTAQIILWFPEHA
eukprot:828296-Pleurochrysis_carterae.AAC.9